MRRGLVFLVLFAATNASLLLLFRFSAERLLLVGVLYGAGTAMMLFLLFHPRNRWLVASRHTVPAAGRPTVALTFDDGPSGDTTPRLLAILREKQVRATFFLVGRRAEAHAPLVRQLVAEGHAVGNHTDSHPELFCFLTPSRLTDEIDRAQGAILRTAGVRPRHFRSPVGLRHPFLAPALERAGLEFVSWGVRSLDTRAQDPDSLRNRILGRVTSGDIVLLHDRPGPGSDAMMAMLPGLIDALRRRGFEFSLL
jgi:peptidoglycan/xylan/chitin deacetylase (PgdA/CDA1 family)